MEIFNVEQTSTLLLSSLASALTSFALLVAGVWGVYTYRKQLRSEAARWSVELYQGFYRDPEMRMARQMVEYEYEGRLKLLVQKRVLNRELQLTVEEREDLGQLDYFLNYLEQLRYLEVNSILSRKDSDVFFSYWFSLLRSPPFSGLRRYLARCGYERLSGDIGLAPREHVVFYGSLVDDSPRQDQIGLRGYLRKKGSCLIEGSLFELPTCPGLRPEGTRQYHSEVYEVTDDSAFKILDEFEEYVAADHFRSRFLRESIWLPEMQLDAWIYFISPDALPDEPHLIEQGSWNDFVSETGKKLPKNPPPLSYL